MARTPWPPTIVLNTLIFVVEPWPFDGGARISFGEEGGSSGIVVGRGMAAMQSLPPNIPIYKKTVFEIKSFLKF